MTNDAWKEYEDDFNAMTDAGDRIQELEAKLGKDIKARRDDG
jgi:hypothetical protein